MYPQLSGAIRKGVQQALGLSARWSVRRAAVILTVLLAHLSLMVSPLHAAHVDGVSHSERFGHGGAQPSVEPSVERSDHGTAPVHAAMAPGAHGDERPSHTTAAPVQLHGASPDSMSQLVTQAAPAEDCGIQWSRTRQQPADSPPLASAAAPGASVLLLSSLTPARSALAAPLRRRDTQALLQVYRL